MINTQWDRVAQACSAFTEMEVIKQWTFWKEKLLLLLK